MNCSLVILSSVSSNPCSPISIYYYYYYYILLLASIFIWKGINNLPTCYMKKWLAIIHCAKNFALILALQFYLISSPLPPLPSFCTGRSSEQSISIHCLLPTHNIVDLSIQFSVVSFSDRKILIYLVAPFTKAVPCIWSFLQLFSVPFHLHSMLFERKQTWFMQ